MEFVTILSAVYSLVSFWDSFNTTFKVLFPFRDFSEPFLKLGHLIGGHFFSNIMHDLLVVWDHCIVCHDVIIYDAAICKLLFLRLRWISAEIKFHLEL
jgi:hypothetical protein